MPVAVQSASKINDILFICSYERRINLLSLQKIGCGSAKPN